MGLWTALRSLIGFAPPLVVRDPAAPLAVSEAAREALAAMPAGHGVHIETVPAHRGRVVQITPGPAQGPPPAPLGDLPVTLSDPDLERLRGRTLDWDGERWTVAVPLELRARETPNPESRLYLCDQVLATGRPAFFAGGSSAGEDLPDLAARLLDVPGVRSVLLREHTVTMEREADVPWASIDRGVDAALREHLILCGGPVAGGEADAPRDPLEAEIRQVLLEKVLPGVHADGGDIELVGFSNGVVKVAMVGACRSCPASSATLRHGVERTLMEAFPGRVQRIEAV
jgi:NFU1 iron-sulfur cluster scaffold homolog, mitochondrial